MPDKRVAIYLATIAIGFFNLVNAGGSEKEFPGRALFERMVGEWTSEGKLTSADTGDVIEVTETWTGKFAEDGKGFVITGDRIWNGEGQTFKWEYSYNTTTDLMEVIYTASVMDKEISMEVSVNEAEGIISLLAPMGTEGAEIQIEKKFEKDNLISRVSVKGNGGQTVLEGSFKHSRKKKDDKKMSDRRPLSLVVCLLTPLVILVIGGAAAVALVIKTIPLLTEENGRGLLPTVLEVQVDKPGTYTVWVHTYTTFEGTVYSADQERLPSGARVLVTEKESGKELPLNTIVSSSKSFGNDRAIGVGTFQASRPMDVLVTVSGLPGPAVFSVAPVKMMAIFHLVASVILIAMVTFVLALIALIILLKRRKQICGVAVKMWPGSIRPADKSNSGCVV